jgi:CheY-like chemotaxis protein
MMMNILPRFRALRVLCVEEDFVQRKLIEVCLDVAQIETFFATNAQQALSLFHRHPFDMIFLDFDRHCEKELAAFRVMRDTPRSDRRTPILAVTNNDCRWTQGSYRQAGFAGLFEKPIEPSRLFRAMDDVLRDYEREPLLDLPYTAQFASRRTALI